MLDLTPPRHVSTLPSAPFDRSRPTSARDQAEENAESFRVGDGAAQHDGDEHVLRRLDATITVHGFRSSFRDWAAETGVEFSVAEQCLAQCHSSNVNRSYLRTSMLELRRPVLASWGSFVCLETGVNVVELRRAGA